MERILDLPAYTAMRERDALRRAVARSSLLFCATVAEGRRISADEKVALHVVGAQRAREGFKEQDLEDAVQCAIRSGWTFFLHALAEACNSPDELRDATVLLFNQVAEFSTDLLGALLRGFETEQTQRLDGYARVQATLIDRLVDGGWDDVELFNIARSDGVRLLSPVAFALVVERAPGDDARRRDVAKKAASILGVEDGPTRVGPVTHTVLLINRATPERMARLLEAECHQRVAAAGAVIALTEAVDLPGSAASYAAVASRLSLLRVARPRGGIVVTDELRLYGLLAECPAEDRMDLALRVLDPLLAKSDSAELLEVFAAYLQFGSSEEARVLLPRITSRTMLWKRLRKVSTLTGLRLDVPREATLLEVAVRFYLGWIEPLEAMALQDVPAPSGQMRLVR